MALLCQGLLDRLDMFVFAIQPRRTFNSTTDIMCFFFLYLLLNSAGQGKKFLLKTYKFDLCAHLKYNSVLIACSIRVVFWRDCHMQLYLDSISGPRFMNIRIIQQGQNNFSAVGVRALSNLTFH